MIFIPYVGSKGKLAKTIIERFPEHKCYVDVFAGAANVLLKKEPSTAEVINDINKELITLYRVVQNHLEEFLRYFKWVLISREEFNRQLNCPPESLTDIQRAARFYYLQKCAFGGKVHGRSFGYSIIEAPRLNLLRIEEDLSAVHLRLARVTIECLPYEDILRRYDRADTLFYLDPPYEGCEDYYGKNIFSKEDYSTLAAILGNLNGKFILSLNDTPYIRKVFKDFKFENVSVIYTVDRNANKRARELIITK